MGQKFAHCSECYREIEKDTKLSLCKICSKQYTPKLIVCYSTPSMKAERCYTVRDCDAISFAEKNVDYYLKNRHDGVFVTSNSFLSDPNNWYITVGTNVMVLAFQLLVSRGKINSEDILFDFEGKNYSVTNHGKIIDYPRGITSHALDMTEEIMKKYCGLIK